MMEKHKFLEESDPRLQDMIKMFKDEEFLSPPDSSRRSNKYSWKKSNAEKRTSKKPVRPAKAKCIERLCLVMLAHSLLSKIVICNLRIKLCYHERIFIEMYLSLGIFTRSSYSIYLSTKYRSHNCRNFKRNHFCRQQVLSLIVY